MITGLRGGLFLLVGAVMGYLSLAAGPIGLVLAFAILLPLLVASQRRLHVGLYLSGLGAVGALILRPAVVNSDPAVHYVSGYDLPALLLYAVIGLAGLGITASSFAATKHRRA